MLKRNFSRQDKITAVMFVKNGSHTISVVVRKYGVPKQLIADWKRNYEVIGSVAFDHNHLTKRTQAEKKAAVLSYVSGEGYLRDVCFKYKIISSETLRQWIKK